MQVSYIEDKNLIAYCQSRKDYSEIDKQIDREKLNFLIKKNDTLFGYKIKKIKQLSDIYGKPFFSVEFYFKRINLWHDEKEASNYNTLVKEMLKEVKKIKGYYIIKIHSPNVNLISAFNQTCISSKEKLLFAGGTVCYAIEKQNPLELSNEIQIIRTDSYISKENASSLEKLGQESFTRYSGQYHISHISREKAPIIYKNWVRDAINDKKSIILLAKLKKKIVGFLIAKESDKTVEIILNAVDENYRGRMIYENLVKNIVNYGTGKGKITTVSTPFDNYPPQRVWVKVGFKPYHSFYIFHYINE